MNFPKTVRVLAVDDNQEEIKPLLQALNKLEVPALHYTGRLEELPLRKKVGIRLLFLDIELEGMEGKTDTEKSSTVCEVVSRLIDLQNNGPLFIVFWTKHVETAETVVKNLQSESPCLIDFIALDKNACKDGRDELDVGKIEQALLPQEGDMVVQDLYRLWEDAVFESAAAISSQLAKSVVQGTDWKDGLSYAFYCMYKAYCAKVELSSGKDQYIAACRVLGKGVQARVIENLKGMKFPQNFKLRQSIAAEKERIVKSKINALITFDASGSRQQSLHAGSCFVLNAESEREKKIRGALVHEILGDENFQSHYENEDVRLCCLVITPQCDYAQNKRLTYEASTVERIVYGVLVPQELELQSKRSERKYLIPDVFFDEKVCLLGFSFATLGFAFSSELPTSATFVLQEEMLFDIQSKAANQINRLGNCLI